MKVKFKSSTVQSPLEIFSGLGINTFGSIPKKLNITNISITSSDITQLNIYTQASDLATNVKTIRHIAYKIDVVPGEILKVIDKPISCTTQYSVFVDKEVSDSANVDVYFEYEEIDDSPFVNSYSV